MMHIMLPYVHRFLAWFGGGSEEFGFGVIASALTVLIVGYLLAHALYGKWVEKSVPQFKPVRWMMLGILLVLTLSTASAWLIMTMATRSIWFGESLNAIMMIPGLEGYGGLMVMVLVFSVLPVIFGILILHREFPKTVKLNKHLRVSMVLLPTVMASAGYFLAFLGFMFLMVPYPIGCQNREFLFHEFNGHLKNVCMSYNSRRIVDDCPRSEEQLKAFNPEAYAQVKACATSYYEFNDDTKRYTWITRWPRRRVYVSDPVFHDGLGILTLGKRMREYDPDQYPPSVPGPWEKLPW